VQTVLVHRSLLDPNNLGNAAQVVTVVATARGFTMKCAEIALDWEFDLSRVQYGPDVLYLVRARSGAWMPVWASELNESRDSWSAIMVRKGIDAFMPIVLIGISPDHADFAAIFFCHTIEPGNASPMVDTVPESGDMVLKRLMPSIEPFLQRQWAKHKLLKEVKTNDSLAALELQLDLLTTIVSSMMNGVKVPSWAAGFAEEMAQGSALTLTAPDVAIGKVGRFKNALRALQAAYLKVARK
jgi:hypothetical protein